MSENTAWKVVPWGLTQGTPRGDHNRDCWFKLAPYSLWFFGVGISNVILSRIRNLKEQLAHMLMRQSKAYSVLKQKDREDLK